MCRLQQGAASCDFGVLQDDYVHHQVIDKCYLSHLGLKFLGQETVTLDCLLGAGSRQLPFERNGGKLQPESRERCWQEKFQQCVESMRIQEQTWVDRGTQAL